MVSEIRRLLSGVNARQRQLRSLDWLVRGAVVGALAGLLIEVARLCGAPLEYFTCWAMVLGSMLTSGIVGWLLPVAWSSTAHLVDTHYQLKDCTASALDFASRAHAEPLMKLQIADAIHSLRHVDPKAVLPLRVPKLLPVAIGFCGLLFILPFLPSEPLVAPEVDTLVQQVVSAQANTLDETVVEELRRLAEESKEPELKKLVEEIEKIIEAMKSPDVDEREALAKLSEMQQNLVEALNQFNPDKTDAELKELAAALESAESMQATSEALKDGKYEKAAEQIEKIEASSMTRQEREAVAANLKKFRENLGEGKQGELSASAQEMQEGLEKDNSSQVKEGQDKAASVFKKQGLKKSIANSLNSQLNRLTECKSQCQAQCAGGAPQKSERDSNKIGKSASNKSLGEEATKLDSKRHEEYITGVQGEGASERETTESPEGEQDSARTYKARYTEFRKQMEEVIDSEPLPLGHRETVRKYFESIRPANGDTTE